MMIEHLNTSITFFAMKRFFSYIGVADLAKIFTVGKIKLYSILYCSTML